MTEDGKHARPWLRTMTARDRDEPHRPATPLELLFDLCFVVAVAQAASGLHHQLADDHIVDAVAHYLPVFFGIWWAWMNFTWFASAYDTDDVPYRLLTFLQIVGVLIFAAGIPNIIENDDLRAGTIGYAIMRVALVAQWLRAAHAHPEGRATSLRYAVGVSAVQVLWLMRLAVPDSWFYPSFIFLAGIELLVPWWAERAGGFTSWHPAHIAERYGLFTIIVLGETVLAATVTVQSGVSEVGLTVEVLTIAGSGLVLLFAAWWTYFQRPAEAGLRLSPESAFVWGYGHYFVFAALAAAGAGLQVAADAAVGHALISDTGAASTIAVPFAVYLLTIGLLHASVGYERAIEARYAAAALAIIGIAASVALVPLAVATAGMALCAAALVASDVALDHREHEAV